MHWLMLTGEYPPQTGGVADYTALVSRALVAAGDTVTVVAPPCEQPEVPPAGVAVHRISDHFDTNGLAELTNLIARQPSPRVVLVQYVPHAFGQRAMNINFCKWVNQLGARERVFVMFHEVSFPFRLAQPIKHNILAAAHWLMARLVARGATRTFVAIPAWSRRLRRHLRRRPEPVWIPVPSNVLAAPGTELRQAARLRVGEGQVIGHFGTYGDAVASVLRDVVPPLLKKTNAKFVLMGRGGRAFAETILTEEPKLLNRVLTTGGQTPEELTAYLGLCDVMLQPYTDGISSRRSSAMAGLALGLPTVTTAGELTEPIWQESGAVSLCPAGDVPAMVSATIALLQDDARRADMAGRARALYADRFSLDRTVSALRDAAQQTGP